MLLIILGCNCEGNCRDNMNCSCWHKTYEATTFVSNKPNFNVGYVRRRLNQRVETGIFECNSNCKCDHRCSNRVVQNGIQIRLQLFKTSSKGWGLRCLDDVPKGTFISTYAGQLMTQEQSDIRGKELGDEYFAELDYVAHLKNNLGLHTDSEAEDDEEEEEEDQDSVQIKVEMGLKKKPVSTYQRPKQNRLKTVVEDNREFILLDSDEDEQDKDDEDEINTIRKSYDEKNKKLELKLQERNNKIMNKIYARPFFTNPQNPNYYKRYLNMFKSRDLIIMDAKLYGNIGRYYNHSCAPNIFVQNVFVDTYDFRFPWLAFFAKSYIKAGTELCWDYGYQAGSVEGKELYCNCGSASCRGRLL
jgi:histone-lysine N-methyltransferase SETDB1